MEVDVVVIEDLWHRIRVLESMLLNLLYDYYELKQSMNQ
jgi:hypothetical protein